MTDTEMNPAASLAGYLCQTTPEQAVKAAMELCEQLPGDPEGFHGGVWPGNVTLDGDGKAVLGMPMSTPAAQRPANQVEYLAPEFFWDGSTSAAADVFSVGLMIYAGCSKGFLPFQPAKDDLSNQERASALRRRMKGEAIPAPEGVSEDLKKVLEKALAYKPEDRYITAKEMLFALHWTDEALGPDKDKDAAAAAAIPEAEAAEPVPEAPAEAPVTPEAPPEPEETTEEMLREADAVLAAAAAAAAVAAGGAAVAAGEAEKAAEGAGGGEAPAGNAEDGQPEDSKTSAEEASPAQTEGGQDFVKEAPSDGADGKAAAAAAAVGTAGAAAAAAGAAAKKEYKVRKDFEKSPDRKAPTVAPAKKKKSKAVPILCGIAAAVLLGSVGYMVYGSRTPGHTEPSPLFTPDSAEDASMETSPTPLVITPEPTGTAKPTDEPETAPDGTAEPGATPGEDGIVPGDDSVIIVTPAPGTIGGAVTAGALAGEAGSGEQTGGNTGGTPGGAGSSGSAGTTPGGSAGTGSGTSSGAGTGSGNTSTGSGAGTSGTGSGGSTSWGGGTGSGGGTSWGGNTGSGGGTSWGGNTGSGGGSTTTPAPSYTVSPADDTVYITGVGVNVRSGPGTSYPIIGSANTGYELKRTGTSGDWSRVTFKGTTGFVSNTYLSTTNPTPSATAQPQQTAQPAPRYTVTGGDLTYTDAKTQAQSQGGLTVIRSDDDFEAVARQLDNGGSGVEYAWLGVEYDSAFDCWRWSDGSVLYTGDSHWAAGNPKAGDDLVLLARQDGSWKFVSLSSSTFDPADSAYAGKLGYVTGS